jgi:hypothetical protein
MGKPPPLSRSVLFQNITNQTFCDATLRTKDGVQPVRTCTLSLHPCCYKVCWFCSFTDKQLRSKLLARSEECYWQLCACVRGCACPASSLKTAVVLGGGPCSLVFTDVSEEEPLDDGGSNFLRNVTDYLPVYTALDPRRQSPSYSAPEAEISPDFSLFTFGPYPKLQPLPPITVVVTCDSAFPLLFQ